MSHFNANDFVPFYLKPHVRIPLFAAVIVVQISLFTVTVVTYYIVMCPRGEDDIVIDEAPLMPQSLFCIDAW